MTFLNVITVFYLTASTVNEAWKYEKIYDSASVIKMEGFNNPFGTKERDIKLDHKKLQLEYALGISNYKRLWPSGRVLAYRAQGCGFNPWPSHT